MDGSTVYSNEPEVNADIRAFEDGLMKTLPVFREQGLMVIFTQFNTDNNIVKFQDLLPLAIEDPDEGCIRPSEDVFCFRTGDPRVNEQTVLAIVHTVMIR